MLPLRKTASNSDIRQTTLPKTQDLKLHELLAQQDDDIIAKGERILLHMNSGLPMAQIYLKDPVLAKRALHYLITVYLPLSIDPAPLLNLLLKLAEDKSACPERESSGYLIKYLNNLHLIGRPKAQVDGLLSTLAQSKELIAPDLNKLYAGSLRLLVTKYAESLFAESDLIGMLSFCARNHLTYSIASQKVKGLLLKASIGGIDLEQSMTDKLRTLYDICYIGLSPSRQQDIIEHKIYEQLKAMRVHILNHSEPASIFELLHISEIVGYQAATHFKEDAFERDKLQERICFELQSSSSYKVLIDYYNFYQYRNIPRAVKEATKQVAIEKFLLAHDALPEGPALSFFTTACEKFKLTTAAAPAPAPFPTRPIETYFPPEAMRAEHAASAYIPTMRPATMFAPSFESTYTEGAARTIWAHSAYLVNEDRVLAAQKSSVRAGKISKAIEIKSPTGP